MNIAVGPIVDASAYAFAPQVIVAPFACLDVIFNALTAPFTLKWQAEVLTKVHFIGCGCVAVGASLTAVLADAENEVYTVYELEKQLLRPQSIVYFAMELSAILTVNWFLRKNLLSPMVRGVSLGVIAGVLMGNVFFVKGIVSLVRHSITTGDTDAWLRLTPYFCLACAAGGAVIGHVFMRKGLAEYKGVFMVTIFEGAHISAACLSGCVVMSEMSGAPWWRYVCYWASVTLILVGMGIINTAAADANLSRQDSKDDKRGTFHIAQHFVDEEEGAGLKEGAAPAPIGKTVIDADLDFGGYLDGDGSPICSPATIDCSMNDRELDEMESRGAPTPSPTKPKSEIGELSSNASTSTPECALTETSNISNEDGTSPIGSGSELASQPPIFSGSG